MAMGKVARRSLDADGRTTGTYHHNPFLNTITYDVEFPDGQVREYGANIFAENMPTQVDSEGYSLSLMDSIIDHQSDTIPTRNGRELGEIWVSELKDKFLGPNWQRMLSCAYTTQLLHSTGEVCWNNKDRYFIWFEFVC